MTKRNQRIAVLSTLLLGALFAAWLAASPYVMLRNLQSAAKARDAAAIVAYVDFPSVRQDLKAKVAARIAAEIGDRSRIRGRGMSMGMMAAAMAGPMIDAMITPEGVAAMMAGDVTKQGGEAAGMLRPAAGEPDVVTEREALGRMSVVDVKSGGGFVIALQGFSWRVVEILIPEPAGNPTT